jgi:hypothetical protein
VPGPSKVEIEDEQVPRLHGADGFYPANEGIRIDQIKAALLCDP